MARSRRSPPRCAAARVAAACSTRSCRWLFVAPAPAARADAGLHRPAVVDRAVDGRPPGGRARPRRQLRDGRRGRAVPAVPGLHARPAAGRAAVEPVHRGRAAVLANMQSAVFSPFSWPAYVLPFWWSLGLIGALKLWVPAFGTFLLARRARAARGRRAAGRAWSPGSGSSTSSGSPGRCRACGRGCRGCCWPPTAWCEDRRARAVRGAGAVVALQFFGGHPETSFHVLAVARAVRAAARPAEHGRRWCASPAACAAGSRAGGGRPAAVPGAARALLATSPNRAGRDAARTPAALRPRARAARLLGPADAAGARAVHRHAGVLRGRAAADARRAVALLRPTQRAGGDRRRGRGRAGWSSLGVQPFFCDRPATCPGFAQAHNTRLAIVTLLCIALLAGWGLDTGAAPAARWPSSSRSRSRRSLAGLARAGALPGGRGAEGRLGLRDADDRRRPAAGVDPDLAPVRGARGGADRGSGRAGSSRPRSR